MSDGRALWSSDKRSQWLQGLGAVFVGLCLWGVSSPAQAKPRGLDSELDLPNLKVQTRRFQHIRGFAARIERESLELEGIPLRGAYRTLWLDPTETRRDRVVAARLPSQPPQFKPREKRFSRHEAIELAYPQARADQRGGRTKAELVYLMVLDQPVLVWEVELALSLKAPAPSQKIVWISAMTGRILASEEQVSSLRETQVFAENPRSTPEPILDELGGLEAVVEGSVLVGIRVAAYNCTDTKPKEEELAAWYGETNSDAKECYPAHGARADANGDFFVPVPNVVFDAENKDPNDAYAEVSIYYHAEKLFAFLAEMGIEETPCELASMLANFHYQEPVEAYPDIDFGPLNNAYYTGRCDPESGPTMVFGQGSEADFSYDGDVVYHELGHGTVRMLTPEGLGSWNLREDGCLRDSKAINESIADYHTMMLTEDPFLAEYVGLYWTTVLGSSIRSGLNENRCPENNAGQEHQDSQSLTAALWASRDRLGAKLDSVVLASLSMLARDATLEEAAAAMLFVADEQVANGAWNEDERELFFRALEARGLIDCVRVVKDPEAVKTETRWYLRQNHRSVTPFWPGPVQLQTVVPEDSDNIVLSFSVTPRGNSKGREVDPETDVRVLVRKGDSIHYRYETISVEEEAGEEVETREVIEVSGDWEQEIVPTRTNESGRLAIVRGFEAGDVVTVSLVNLSYENQAVAREIYLTSVPTSDLNNGSPPDDDGSETPDRQAIEALGDGSAGACVCTATPGSAPSAGIWALLFFVVAGARRRGTKRGL